MDGEPEKKITFDDDAIRAAEQVAHGVGKANFDKQREVFGRAHTDAGEMSSIAPTASHRPQTQPIAIKSLRTFQGDIAEAIKNQNASVITIAVAEQKKKERKEAEATFVEYTPQNEVERIMGKKAEPMLRKKEVPAPEIPIPQRPAAAVYEEPVKKLTPIEESVPKEPEPELEVPQRPEVPESQAQVLENVVVVEKNEQIGRAHV